MILRAAMWAHKERSLTNGYFWSKSFSFLLFSILRLLSVSPVSLPLLKCPSLHDAPSWFLLAGQAPRTTLLINKWKREFFFLISTLLCVCFRFPFLISFFPYSTSSFHCLAFSILSQTLLISFPLLGFINLPRLGQSKEKYAFHRRRSCRGQHHGSYCRSWGKGCRFIPELLLSLILSNLPWRIRISK